MTVFSPERLPADPTRAVAVNDARLVVQTCRSLLGQAAFVHNLPVAVLSKIAADDKLPVRERRHAAHLLALYQVKLLELLAQVTGARELALAELAVADASVAPTVNVTQVNQATKIEILRDDDWRAGGDGGG